MMHTAPFLLFASATLTAALPNCGSAARVPVLPKTGTGKDLPQPPAGVTLKHIALGLGIQNYTCSQVGATVASAGALAMLYDITDLYPGQGSSSLSPRDFDGLTSRALRRCRDKVPINFNHSAAGRVHPDHPGATLIDPFPRSAALELWGLKPVPFLGHHFFDANGIPTFVLDDGKIYLPTSKKAAVGAPKGADAGPDGTGAVGWLYLESMPGARGAKYVYRVLTAGGVSHGCAHAAGKDSTIYAATYWFYG